MRPNFVCIYYVIVQTLFKEASSICWMVWSECKVSLICCNEDALKWLKHQAVISLAEVIRGLIGGISYLEVINRVHLATELKPGVIPQAISQRNIYVYVISFKTLDSLRYQPCHVYPSATPLKNCLAWIKRWPYTQVIVDDKLHYHFAYT